MRLRFYQPAGDHDRKYLLNPIFPRRQFQNTAGGGICYQRFSQSRKGSKEEANVE